MSGSLRPGLREAMPRMTSALSHRGPDGEDFFFDDRAALGHRRLSIIDIAGGAQPMANEDGTIWTIFNGEIYNHHSLRDRLESLGHVFRTRCDTEVIVHAYEEFGTASAEYLDGQFAYAVYDQRRGALYLARDRLGQKPLFYSYDGETLQFASEVKALELSPLWDGSWDRTVLEEYFALGYILAPSTLYRSVKKLPPASSLFLDSGSPEIRQYWRVQDFDTDLRSEEALLEDLESIFGNAVGSRLESEVPLGAFLSAGIDSGLVVSFMSELGATRPTTCSVGFADGAHNELEGAARTASRFETDHRSHVLDRDLSEAIDIVVPSFDEPFADSSAIPTYFLSEIARRHVTVCLSGDGGDESFGGYDFRYTPHALESRVRRVVPGEPGRRTLRWLGRNWPRSSFVPRWLRLSTYMTNIGWNDATAYFLDLCFMSPTDASRLVGRESVESPDRSSLFQKVTDPYLACPSPSPVQRAQFADLTIYLPNDVLVKVDRMSMKHGLEVRCPLLDHRLVEFAFRVPTKSKLPRFQSKYLLRRLAGSRLPRENLALKKHGFTAPVGEWFRGFLGDRFEAEVLGPGAATRSFIDTDLAAGWLREHRGNQVDRSYHLWAILTLEIWAREHRSG